MSNKVFDGNVGAVFECSECDFKCASEDYMIEHSAKHTSSGADSTVATAHDVLNKLGNENIPDGAVGLIPEDEIKKENQVDMSESRLDNDNITEGAVGLIPVTEIKKEKQEDMTENNNLSSNISTIKREIDSCEDNYSVESNQEHYFSNIKKIKLEYMDILQEFQPHFLSQASQMNEYDNVNNVQQYPNSHDDNNTGNGTGISGAKKCYDSRTLFSSNDTLYKNLGAGNLPLFMPKQIEIEVDSADIYIPPGWKRQVLMNTRLSEGNIKYDCYYLTHQGTIIHNKEEALKYLLKNPCPDVDADKLDFMVSESKWYPVQSTLDHDIDNTGVYIPDGWHRKLNVITSSNPQIKYNITYISPEGNRFKCKTEVCSYISNSCTEDLIDPEKMDFSVKRPLSTAFNKIEIEVDNTELFIPEGWQRKLYQYTNGSLKGKHIVGYVSPCNTFLFSKTQVYDYLKKLESDEKSLYLEVEKMNFSRTFYNPAKSSDESRTYGCGRREIPIDNSGIYIPEGWERKMYQYTNGGSKGKYFVGYISPSGKYMYSKSQIRSYNEKLDRNGMTGQLDVDKMNFSRSIHNLTKKSNQKRFICSKEEVKVDNAGIYIPEGWERKVFQYTNGKSKGNHCVLYIAPCGKSFYDKRQVVAYNKELESNEKTDLIPVEKLNFSTAIHNIRKVKGE